MTRHSVMKSSLRFKIVKINKFGDFSCDIDYNSRTTYLEMLSPLLLIKVTSGAHKVSASRAAQASEARLSLIITVYTRIIPPSSKWNFIVTTYVE